MGYDRFSGLGSMKALVDQIDQWLVETQGWTQNALSTSTDYGYAAWSVGDCYIQVEYGGAGTPSGHTLQNSVLRIYQSGDYAGRRGSSGAVGARLIYSGLHGEFGGTGATDSKYPSVLVSMSSSTASYTPALDITDGTLHCFGSDPAELSNKQYAHFVLDPVSGGQYRHFGWGHGEPYGSGYGSLPYKYGSSYGSSSGLQATESLSSDIRALMNFEGGETTPTWQSVALPDLMPESDYATVKVTAGAIPRISAGTTWLVNLDLYHAGAGEDNSSGFIGMFSGCWTSPFYGSLLSLRGDIERKFLPLFPNEIALSYRDSAISLSGKSSQGNSESVAASDAIVEMVVGGTEMYRYLDESVAVSDDISLSLAATAVTLGDTISVTDEEHIITKGFDSVSVQDSALVRVEKPGQVHEQYLLGKQRDVFVCNIADIGPGEEVEIGGLYYVFFPLYIKSTQTGYSGYESKHCGIAYVRR